MDVILFLISESVSFFLIQTLQSDQVASSPLCQVELLILYGVVEYFLSKHGGQFSDIWTTCSFDLGKPNYSTS